MRLRPPTLATQVTLAASLVVLLGAVVLLGWAMGINVLVRPRPGWTPMVVNTAIGFVLAGLGLVLAAGGGQRRRSIAMVIGIVVALLGIEELVVLVLDLSPALSLPELHRPLQPDYPHPGRMAPNTALCFVLFGAALAGLSWAPGRTMARAARSVAIAVGGIGLIGAAGYALQLEYLYGWAGVVRMAAHTAIGMVVLGVGLSAQASSLARPSVEESSHRVSAVFRTAALLLLLCAASSGLLGFGFLQSVIEAQERDHLAQMADERIAMFDTVISYRTTRAEVLASGLPLEDVMAASHAAPLDPTIPVRLRAWATAASAHGFSYVGLDIGGRSQDLLGEPATPALSLDLAGPSAGRLLWDDGYVLRWSQTMANAGGTGRLVTEQRLDSLTNLSRDTNAFGTTTELAVCGGDAQTMRCFPVRNRPQPFSSDRIVAGQRLPMDRALRGDNGTIIALDYRRQRVLAGYGPIGGTGLGLVAKRDIVEIYAPIRREFEVVMLFLGAFIMIGLWIMHRQLLPLLSALEASRTRATADLARLDAAVESHMDAFFILECVRDDDGTIQDMRYTMLNSMGEEILARSRAELLGRGMCEIFPVLREDGLLAACVAVVETGEHRVVERASVARGMHWYHMQLVKLGDGVGLTVRDITVAHHSGELTRHQAMHDPLTGAVNRAGFDFTLSDALASAAASGTTAAVALLDLDKFKEVNDRLGHEAGDQLLVEVVRRLKAAVRPTDTVARYGGDEFVVVLRDVEPVHGLEAVARKLLALVSRPIELSGEVVEITISLGISSFPRDGSSREELLRAADAAMYRAKHAGRNQFFIATPPG